VSWTREGDIKIAPPPSIVDPDATVRSRFIGHAAIAAVRAAMGLMTKSLDEPLGVVARDELADDPARVGETLEAMEVEALLLERPHEALDDAIALRFADVRRRDRHPQPLHLVDPRIGNVLRPPVAADPQAACDILREAAARLGGAARAPPSDRRSSP